MGKKAKKRVKNEKKGMGGGARQQRRHWPFGHETRARRRARFSYRGTTCNRCMLHTRMADQIKELQCTV